MNYKIPALILCFFILTLSSEASYGAYKSGGKLHEQCTTPKSSDTYYLHTAECRGYVLGVHDNWYHAAVIGYCIPGGANAGQLVAIVTKYLKENPENWHYSANSIVKEALQKAFPCE